MIISSLDGQLFLLNGTSLSHLRLNADLEPIRFRTSTAHAVNLFGIDALTGVQRFACGSGTCRNGKTEITDLNV